MPTLTITNDEWRFTWPDGTQLVAPDKQSLEDELDAMEARRWSLSLSRETTARPALATTS